MESQNAPSSKKDSTNSSGSSDDSPATPSITIAKYFGEVQQLNQEGSFVIVEGFGFTPRRELSYYVEREGKIIAALVPSIEQLKGNFIFDIRNETQKIKPGDLVIQLQKSINTESSDSLPLSG